MLLNLHILNHWMLFLNHPNPNHRILFLNHCTPNHWISFLKHCRPKDGVLILHLCIQNHWISFLKHCQPKDGVLILYLCNWDHFSLQRVLCSTLNAGWTHSRMTPWCLLQLLCILCNSTECTVSYVQLLQIATMRVAVRSGLTRGTLCASLHSVIVTHHMQEWRTVLSHLSNPSTLSVHHYMCSVINHGPNMVT